MWLWECKKSEHKERVVMAGESTSDRDEYNKQFDEFKANGFDDYRSYKVADMEVPYGINVLHVSGGDEQNEMAKMIVRATNPIVAMTETWEAHIQNGIAAGISALIDVLQKESAKGNAEKAIETLYEHNKDDGFAKIFITQIMEAQPDIISVGNPHILANVVAKQMPDLSVEVENFLKQVVEKEEEE